MKRDIKKIKTEDGSDSLYVPELKETYHSFHGALQESQHVFIEHGLDHHFQLHHKQPVHVFELGLGTGLNALLTAQWSDAHQQPVKMESVEAFPLEEELALSLNFCELMDTSGCKQWFEKIHGSPWDTSCDIHSFFDLKKITGKAEYLELGQDLFDVIYYDAFAPNKQAELWEMPVLEKICHTMKTSGIFVTYCAKGQLKRDLTSLGLTVETLPGPPGKKEMVRAIKI
ncbi:MAG: tRNA (5-methylaminomethyl-2-thiouridine)(34)-methyltransferase MnmD [Fulvivirga sp.]|nr:tRNA (5-methylaminomethyl-2-thiouridine)(34)-methyltransferase MnmD [Fulvivirga sp.]